MRLAWHFVRRVNGIATLRDGRPVPLVGEWLEHVGDVVICKSGLHASDRAMDALGFVEWDDAVACLVEVDDVFTEQTDKLVCRRRRLVGMCDADPVLRIFAREQALSVAHLWAMPAVVREYLDTGRDEIRDAARDAAWDAAWAASWDAARDAARYAARYAARDAARDAARYAASASAMDAARASAWDAARASAWDAARDAARASAWDAARYAARYAASDAARDLLESMLLSEMEVSL